MATIEGTDIGNTLFDTNEDDVIYGYGGRDNLSTTLGRDFVSGGEGTDRLNVNWSSATGDITFFAISGTFGWVNTGGNGGYSDSLRRVDFTGIERLSFRGGSGNDTIEGVANSDDFINGGGGIDLWIDSFSADVAGRSVVLLNTRSGLEHARLTFGSGDDFFRDHQGHHDDVIYGGQGDDRVMLRGGRDFFSGGSDPDGEDFDQIHLDWGNSTKDVTIFGTTSTFAWEANAGNGGYSESTRRVDYSGVESIIASTGSGNDYAEGVANSYDLFLLGGGRDTYKDSFSAAPSGVFANIGQVTMGTERLSTAQGAERFLLTLSEFDDRFVDRSGLHSSIYSSQFLKNVNGQFDDVIYGLDGDDEALFRRGKDFFSGGAGDDLLHVRWNDTDGDISFFASTATFGWVDETGGQGYSDSRRRIDYSGVERLRIEAGTGDDYIQGIPNAPDFLTGSTGIDLVDDDFSEMTQAIKINLFTGGATLPDGSYFWGFEAVDFVLGLGNDVFKDWRDYDDVIRANDGNDTITLNGGRDFVDGGEGDDLLVLKWQNSDLPTAFFATSATFAYSGESFSSADLNVDFVSVERFKVYTGDGADSLQGGASKDVLDSGAGADTLNGAGGNDKLKAGGGDDSLLGGDGNDTLEGQFGDDIANGGAGNDLVKGDSGKDEIGGGDGNDRLKGGSGQDTLLGDAGADLLDGGKQVDMADYSASSAGVTVNLGSGRGSGGDAEGDTLVDIEGITGSIYGDKLVGNGEANLLVGERGDDTLKAGADADTLEGGSGSNLLEGQAGADRFVISSSSGTDTIGDFNGEIVGEVIDLAALTTIENWEDLRTNHLGEIDGETAIIAGSKRIILEGVDAGDLRANDFEFA